MNAWWWTDVDERSDAGDGKEGEGMLEGAEEKDLMEDGVAGEGPEGVTGVGDASGDSEPAEFAAAGGRDADTGSADSEGDSSDASVLVRCPDTALITPLTKFVGVFVLTPTHLVFSGTEVPPEVWESASEKVISLTPVLRV